MRRRAVYKKVSGSCPSYIMGKYTSAEIDDLVFVDGYIPVASADEFNSISSGVSETMGVGTCWEDSYTTGIGEKYIQVQAIDWSGAGSRVAHFSITGIYDGNELDNTDYTGSVAMFRGSSGTLRNIYMTNVSISGTGSKSGITLYISEGLISNCHVYSGSITTSMIISSAAGIVSYTSAVAGDITIENCSNAASISGSENCGGIIGDASGTASYTVTVENCTNTATISSSTFGSTADTGGIIGLGTYLDVSDCTNSGDVTNTSGVILGGIIGLMSTSCSIESCVNNGDVTATSSSYAGGICGFNSGSNTYANCTNNGDVSNSGNHVAGVVCNLTSRITITGCTNTGNVSGSTQFIGGITTYIYNALDSITDCVVQNCSITSAGGANSVRMGGIAYFRLGGTVEDCRIENVNFTNSATGSFSSTGGVTGTVFQGVNIIKRCEVIDCDFDTTTSGDRCGGIIGRSRATSTSNDVIDCRVVGGSINGDTRLGGIWGDMDQAVDTITNSYASISITGNSIVGGLVGEAHGSATSSNSYWDTDIGPATSAGGAVGKTTSELQTPTDATGIYSAWDDAVWDFGTDSEYPTLSTTP